MARAPTTAEDAAGLRASYSAGRNLRRGATYYIRGSQSVSDWSIDAGLATSAWPVMLQSERFKAPSAYLRRHPSVERVVGHSLGGTVAVAIAPSRAVTYDPYLPNEFFVRRAMAGTVHRDILDPASVFSAPYASNHFKLAWPHSLANFE